MVAVAFLAFWIDVTAKIHPWVGIDLGRSNLGFIKSTAEHQELPNGKISCCIENIQCPGQFLVFLAIEQTRLCCRSFSSIGKLFTELGACYLGLLKQKKTELRQDGQYFILSFPRPLAIPVASTFS